MIPYLHSPAQQSRRLVYHGINGILGLLITLFNGFILLVYYRRELTRKHFTPLMINLFAYCCLSGIVFGVVYPVKDLYRYDISTGSCVVMTMLEEFFEKYIMLCLPILAVERSIFVWNPFISRKKITKISIWLLVGLAFAAVLYSWLPLIPQLKLPEEYHLHTNDSGLLKELELFYNKTTCDHKLNNLNRYRAMLTIIIETVAIAVTFGVYIWIVKVIKSDGSKFKDINMTSSRKSRVKKAALLILSISLTYVFTLLPHAIDEHFNIYCSADSNVPLAAESYCKSITFELGLVLDIVAHLGNFINPLLLITFNPSIRTELYSYVTASSAVFKAESSAKVKKPIGP